MTSRGLQILNRFTGWWRLLFFTQAMSVFFCMCLQGVPYSSELRRIALIIILMRAGLSMNVSGLKKVGPSAILMWFIPATLEILGYFFIAPHFLGTTKLEALIIGAVLAAVSPAVIVPRKIRLTEEGYGTKKQIPQMILAGASVDDVFVIVIFSTFISMAQGKEIDAIKIASIPHSPKRCIYAWLHRS